MSNRIQQSIYYSEGEREEKLCPLAEKKNGDSLAISEFIKTDRWRGGMHAIRQIQCCRGGPKIRGGALDFCKITRKKGAREREACHLEKS